MTSHHPNYRLAKIHRNYTVDEVAKLFGVHRNTVREWVRRGLPTNDDKRPMLILGRDLYTFLHERRLKSKQPCGPGQLYCVRCRVAQTPAENMAEYQPLGITFGNLVGICPCCESMMYRRVSLANLSEVGGTLDVAGEKAPRHSTAIQHPFAVSADSQPAR